MSSHGEPCRLADKPEDYAHFNLERRHIQQWEDGQRVDAGAPFIEWWYFDTDLDDGAKLAVIFCTKDASRPNQPLEPLIEIDLDLPDGRRMMKYGYFKAEEFSASKDGCDVRIGPYRFTGNLHEYTITGGAEDLWAEVKLEGTTEPWRPETGYLVFGPASDKFFAWSPFVPFGKVTATYKIGDEDHQATGTGYHDHNWMNVEMSHLLDHWWWARGDVGPYTFVMAHLVAAEKYGLTPFELYVLARDGKVIADDGAKVDLHAHRKRHRPTHRETRSPDDPLRLQRWGHALRAQPAAPEDAGYPEDARLRQGLAESRGRADPLPRRVPALRSAARLQALRGGRTRRAARATGVFEQMYFARKIHEESRWGTPPPASRGPRSEARERAVDRGEV